MTGLGDKIKVERLDTARLARIEQRVLAARELPGEGIRGRSAWPRWAPLAAAACAIVLVAGALGYWLRGPGGGAVASSAPVPAITTGPGESATVAVGDAIVTIAQSSQVSIRALPDGRIDLDLERGRVDCDVTPRPSRPPFAVHAADVDVSVVGTAFSVERSGVDVRVSVTRGKVSVARDGQQLYLAAGEAWPAGTQVASADPDPDPDPEPEPDPGPEKTTGRGQQATGNGQRATEKPSKASVKLPTGMPALADCADCLAIATGDDKTYTDATQSRALYTHIHRVLSQGDRSSALRYADFYLRRFPKGAETAAVRQLRRTAEGSE